MAPRDGKGSPGIVGQIAAELPRSIEDLEHRSLEYMLCMVGAALGILLGVLLLLPALVSAPSVTDPLGFLGRSLRQAFISVVFSFGLLLSAASMNRGARNVAYISGAISSVVLIVLGGQAGMVGGLLGLIGVILHVLKRESLI